MGFYTITQYTYINVFSASFQRRYNVLALNVVPMLKRRHVPNGNIIYFMRKLIDI